MPETYLEAKRREAQALYLQEQQYIKEHKEEFEALLEQDRQQQAAQASGNLFAALGSMTGLPAPPLPGQEGASAAPGAPGSAPQGSAPGAAAPAQK